MSKVAWALSMTELRQEPDLALQSVLALSFPIFPTLSLSLVSNYVGTPMWGVLQVTAAGLTMAMGWTGFCLTLVSPNFKTSIINVKCRCYVVFFCSTKSQRLLCMLGRSSTTEAPSPAHYSCCFTSSFIKDFGK